MWTDTRYCVPLIDGTYMVQTVFGDVQPMLYTFDGGWNTSRDSNGRLDADMAVSKNYVVRWYTVEQPPEVPKEWYNEYFERGN